MISAQTKGRPLHEKDIRDLLARQGFRITKQRLAIVRELAKARQPTSHTELTDRLAGSKLDRATVYRNLLILTKAGVLVRTQLGDNVWRFGLPDAGHEGHGAHPHFVCSHCGAVLCIPESSVVLWGEAARNEVVDVQLRGRCYRCTRGGR